MSKVIDVVRIIGRGNIVVCNNENNMHVGNMLEINGMKFEIRGIECHYTLMTNPSPSKRIGLILNPNTAINSKFIGKEIKLL